MPPERITRLSAGRRGGCNEGALNKVVPKPSEMSLMGTPEVGNCPIGPHPRSRFLLVLVSATRELGQGSTRGGEAGGPGRAPDCGHPRVVVPWGRRGLSPWKPGSAGRHSGSALWEQASEPGAGAGRRPPKLDMGPTERSLKGTEERAWAGWRTVSTCTHPSRLPETFGPHPSSVWIPSAFLWKECFWGEMDTQGSLKKPPKEYNLQIILGEGMVSALMDNSLFQPNFDFYTLNTGH